MKTTTFSLISATLALYTAGQDAPSNATTMNTASNMNDDSSNNMDTPSSNMQNNMPSNNMRPVANNEMTIVSPSPMNTDRPMCNDTVTKMAIKQWKDVISFTSCSKAVSMPIKSINDVAKLSTENLLKMCSSPECIKPFSDMASSTVYKSCDVMYDGKKQNLAVEAGKISDMCKKDDKDEKLSGSTDNSVDAEPKESVADPTVKDEKSSAAFHSFSAVCIAVTFFVLASY
ncbi:unnamed protein product [Albugo candida]|uniref:Elicitin-like protein n=1 Tax=Albugo candida TaxID=65357 RepID=A0A024GLV4_9STRA|nr:unnamed protein product [Albugo candida]|eukprot:CCI47317.1 unnamed protein product [Albugo candida]